MPEFLEVAGSEVDPAEEAKLYCFSKMPEEWLKENLSRRMVIGKNEMLGYVVLLKGCVVPAHKHQSEQITIITKGALKFNVGGKEVIVKEGDALVIPPYMEHSAVALEDTVDIDCFSPLREDWISGGDSYLRGGSQAKK